ncbi:MAG: cytidine deaminase [Candidatus Protochlamydia sp.]|nr:cytidine deaminase [Candidatus Protochlamydia sp.]
MEEDIWTTMYNSAQKILLPRQISPFINAGNVVCALLTTTGNLYFGVCIDTSCTLGMCAERNAIGNMITNGEHKILKLLCLESSGAIIPPCGACRECLMQLDFNNKNIEILLNFQSKHFVILENLLPNWWGNKRWVNPGF